MCLQTIGQPFRSKPSPWPEQKALPALPPEGLQHMNARSINVHSSGILLSCLDHFLEHGFLLLVKNLPYVRSSSCLSFFFSSSIEPGSGFFFCLNSSPFCLDSCKMARTRCSCWAVRFSLALYCDNFSSTEGGPPRPGSGCGGGWAFCRERSQNRSQALHACPSLLSASAVSPDAIHQSVLPSVAFCRIIPAGLV